MHAVGQGDRTCTPLASCLFPLILSFLREEDSLRKLTEIHPAAPESLYQALQLAAVKGYQSPNS